MLLLVMKFIKSNDLVSNGIVFKRKSSPGHHRERNKQYPPKIEYTTKSFQMLFMAFSWIGITFTKPSVNRQSNCLTLWDLLMLLSVFISFIFNAWGLLSCRISDRLVGVVLCYQGIAILIRIALLLKRKKMFLVVSSLFCWFSNSSAFARKHFTSLKIQICLYYSSVVVFIVFIYFWCSKLAPIDKEFWNMFGFEIDYNKISVLIYFTRFCVFCNSVNSYVTITLASLFCANFFLRADYMMRTLGLQFKRDTKLKRLTNTTILSFINKYQNTISIVSDVDSIISDCCILVYASSVTAFFGSISIYFSKFKPDVMMILYTFVASTVCLVTFFILTITGSNASSEYENIRLVIMDGFEIVADSQDNQLLSTYKLLLDILNHNKIYFTGFKMFIIDKGLILSTGGVLLTYGFILFW